MVSSNILVLGGAGYIGGLVTDYINEQKDLPLAKVYDNLLYEDRFLKDVPFICGDIRDTKSVLKNVENTETVILLAALVGDQACNVNQKLSEEVNYEAVRNICKFLPQDVHVVFASTCSVYGSSENSVTEESRTKPLSCYASTKLQAEKHVLNRGGTVFRLGTVYGVGDQFSRIRADLVVNTLTIKAFSEGEITINGGAQYRPIISVKDVAHYIIEACERKVSGLYNIAFTNMAIYEIAEVVKTVFPEVQVNMIGEMFEDERNYKVSTEKANKSFIHKPTISVIDEIFELYSLLKEGRIKNPKDVNYHNGMFLAQKRL